MTGQNAKGTDRAFPGDQKRPDGAGSIAGYLAAVVALFAVLALPFAGIAVQVAALLEAAGSVRHERTLFGFVLLPWAGFTFVLANLTAKRARDIGLPGWTTVVVLALIGHAADYLLPDTMARLIGLAMTAALILVPSDTVRRTERMVGG